MESKAVYGTGAFETYEGALADLTAELERMLIKKHHDYGHENLTRFGQMGILIRMADKMARLEHGLRSEPWVVDGETDEDTLLDLAGYALQAILLKRGKLALPTSDRRA